MKISVASEFTSTHIENDLELLVISKMIERYREVLWASKVLIVGYSESLFFYWDDR